MKKHLLVFALVTTLATLTQSAQATDQFVGSIAKAPISPDGNVAGAITDIVIDLDRSLDPDVNGRSLLAGRSIKVTLPDAFVDTGQLPLQDVFSSPTCVPGNLQCSTAVLLQGWPQRPILPSFPPNPPGTGLPQYSLSLEGSNTIVFTADIDLTPGVALAGPGIKQIHLILYGYTNPAKPGFYPVTVEAETGPNGEIESGVGSVQIIPRTRPSINVTSVFNPGSPNTIYQHTAPGELTPLPYDFLLWDRQGSPLEGVTIEMVNTHHGLLRQGRRVVGQIKIDTPPGASGQEVFTLTPSAPINAPISGIPTAHLTSYFRAGSVSGEYVVRFSLNGGNQVQMFVTVD